MLQVYYKGKRKQISTGLKVELKYWDEVNECANSKMPNAPWFNQMLKNQYYELEKKYFEQALSGGINLQVSEKVKEIKFADYGYTVYNNLKNRCSPGYIMRAKSVITDFKRFAGDINFSALTVQILKDYENSMFNRGLHTNTVNRHFKRLSQVCMDALKNKVIKESPFTLYKIVSYKQTKRDFLTIDEIKLIEDVNLSEAQDKIRNYFLLCCNTGLRFADAVKFTKEKYVIKNKDVERIILGTSKTGEIISIKLSEKVKELIDKIKTKLPSNYRTNLYLDDIRKLAGINRKVTWHMARHSAAVNMASSGVPIEGVAKILGHSSIKTTAIYFQLIDPAIDGYMDRFNDFSDDKKT